MTDKKQDDVLRVATESLPMLKIAAALRDENGQISFHGDHLVNLIEAYEAALEAARALTDRIAELERFELACKVWADKTEWVQRTARAKDLGKHRADVMHSRIAELEEENRKLEILCEATYVERGADAYHHACEQMERYQDKRRKAGKEVGTTHSLCFGMDWVYERLDELEAQLEAVGAGGVGAMLPRHAQPAPAVVEPVVAWRYQTPTGWHATTDAAAVMRIRAHHTVEPLYTSPQQIAEPAVVGPVTQAGWKLVPVVPTGKMLFAGDSPGGNGTRSARTYAAMLAAAPQPQPQQIAEPAVVGPADRHLPQNVAELLIDYFLRDELGVKCAPSTTLEKQGEDESETHIWAFWIEENDTTSYLGEDGRIQWFGTAWTPDTPRPQQIAEPAPAVVGPVASSAMIARLRENHVTWRDTIDRCAEAADLLEVMAQQPQQIAEPESEPMLRFCPSCGSCGPVPAKFRDCCPDGSDSRVIPAALANKCRNLFQLAIAKAITKEPS